MREKASPSLLSQFLLFLTLMIGIPIRPGVYIFPDNFLQARAVSCPDKLLLGTPLPFILPGQPQTESFQTPAVCLNEPLRILGIEQGSS